MKNNILCRLIIGAVILISGLTGVGCGGQQPAPASGTTQPAPVVNWALGTSGSGSSPYIIGGAVCDVANKNLKGLQISPQVTAGFEENAKLVGEKQIELGETGGPQLDTYYAKFPNIRGLFNVGQNPIHILVSGKSGVTSIEGLKGKKVNVGAPGQATRVIAIALLKSYGLTTEDFTVSSLTTGESLDALKDENIDAAIVIAGLPMPGIAEVAVSKQIKLLPLTGDKAAQFNEVAMKNTLTPVTIPAGTYKGVDYEVATLSSPLAIFGHKDLDETMVYQFTKAVWDNLEQLQKSHASFMTTKRDKSAIGGWNVPMHPGAVKYFKEVGLIK